MGDGPADRGPAVTADDEMVIVPTTMVGDEAAEGDDAGDLMSWAGTRTAAAAAWATLAVARLIGVMGVGEAPEIPRSRAEAAAAGGEVAITTPLAAGPTTDTSAGDAGGGATAMDVNAVGAKALPKPEVGARAGADAGADV